MPQTIVLTGCASGIARRLAGDLYARRHWIVATDIDESALHRAAKDDGWFNPDRVVTRRLDIRDRVAWESLLEETVARFGGLDVLLNVAGYLVPRWAKDATEEDVHRTIDVNVKGMMFGTNAAVRLMVPRGSGHIVNIASLAGIVPVPGIALYSASKHAARAYSIAVAEEVRAHGVYVTAVCPALVATPMMDVQVSREEAAYTFSGSRPLTVDEVSHAIIDRVLVDKPLELVLTPPGSQALMSKLGNAFPSMSRWLGGRVAAAGRKNQSKLRRGTS